MTSSLTSIDSDRRNPLAAVSDARDARRVLVVTSGSGVRTTLLRLLERAPGGAFVPTTTPHAGDAVRRLRGGRFAAAIVDAEILHGGWPTLGRVCEADPATPVLVVAPSGDETIAAHAVRHGAQEVLFRGSLTPARIEIAIACAAERVHKLVELRDLSLTDALTGLYNRRGFVVLADAHLRMLRRTGSRSLLIVADVDRLKDLNDRFGHAAGDRAIRNAADALRSSLRDSDVIARYGGDEFVALAHDVVEGASIVLLTRIQTALAEMNARAHVPFDVTLSIGTASIESNGLDLEAILAQADRELYRSKRRRGQALTPVLRSTRRRSATIAAAGSR